MATYDNLYFYVMTVCTYSILNLVSKLMIPNKSKMLSLLILWNSYFNGSKTFVVREVRKIYPFHITHVIMYYCKLKNQLLTRQQTPWQLLKALSTFGLSFSNVCQKHVLLLDGCWWLQWWLWYKSLNSTWYWNLTLDREKKDKTS